MLVPILLNNWNFWTVNLIMRAKKIVNQSSDFRVRRTGSYRHKKALILWYYFVVIKCTRRCNAERILQLATPTNAVIGRSPAQRRAAATSKNPTTCTLPSDVISHHLIHQPWVVAASRSTGASILDGGNWGLRDQSHTFVKCLLMLELHIFDELLLQLLR